MSLLIYFEIFQISLSHTARVEIGRWRLLMVNIAHICKNSLNDKSILFNHIYLTQRQNYETGLYCKQVGNILALHPQLFCQ